MKKVALLCRNFDIGGPQKSLIALLDNFDYQKADVTLYYVYGGGVLQPYVNEHVHLASIDPLMQSLLLEKGRLCRNLQTFLKKGYLGPFFYALYLLAVKAVTGKSMNMMRQRMLQKYSYLLSSIETEYDFAAAVTDYAMTYYMADAMHAKKKFHWVRSDYRIMDLDHEIEAFYFRKLDGAFAVSKECADIFTSVYPFMQGKVFEFINYIPQAYYAKLPSEADCIPQDGKLKIVSACRIDPLKGLELAIEACRILIHEYDYTDFCWYVLGTGPRMPEIREQIAAAGVADHFIMLGMKKNVMSILNQCDIFVHPSRTEGRSNAVEEAKAAALAVVLTHYDTAQSQISNGTDGIICDIDSHAIAAAVFELVRHPEQAQAYRDHLRERIRREYQSLNLIYSFLESE